MPLGFWLWVVVLVVLCAITPVAWAWRTFRQWRQDLLDVRRYREAVQTPAGRALFRRMVACRDTHMLSSYDAEMEHYLRGRRSL